MGLIPSQIYQNFNLEIGDDENSQTTNQQDIHNVSLNEAAVQVRDGAKNVRIENGRFSIDVLGRLHEESMQRIRQDLRKNYWGSD